MEKYEIDKNSLTWKWITSLSVDENSRYSWPTDFCSYWRHVLIWSPILFSGIAALTALITLLLILVISNPITSAAALLFSFGVLISAILFMYIMFLTEPYIVPVVSFIYKYTLRYPVNALGWIFKKVFVFIGDLFLKLEDYIIDYKSRKAKTNPSEPVVKKDGFLKTRYKAWKENYCPMIEYKLTDE